MTDKAKDEVIKRAEAIVASKNVETELLLDEYVKLLKAYKKLLKDLNKLLRINTRYQTRLEKIANQYDRLKKVILPICVYVRKMKMDSNYWQIEELYPASKSEYGDKNSLSITDNVGLKDKREKRYIKEVYCGDPLLTTTSKVLENQSVTPNQLKSHLRKLLREYKKLLKRFTKAITISDLYQENLKDSLLQLDVLSKTDTLTGLPNRYELGKRLEAEKSRAERHGRVFSIIMLDIDHFKAINDEYGHEAGDRCLVEIAKCILANIRKEDTCGRWGGEEFLVLLPETDIEQAILVGSRIIESIRKADIFYTSERLKLTVSGGVSVFEKGQSIDECIKLADIALYKSKQRGRDCLSW